MELGKAINHTITIDPSDNKGFAVKIGCGMFVAESAESLINGLNNYLEDPKAWEEKYNENRPCQPEEAEDTAEAPPIPTATRS